MVGGFPVFCSPRWLTGVDSLLQDPAIEEAAEVNNEDRELALQSAGSVKSSVLILHEN